MFRDEPIRLHTPSNRFFAAQVSRSEAHRQFRTSLVFMSVLVCALGAGILVNLLPHLGAVAH